MTATALRAAVYSRLTTGVPSVPVWWPNAPQPADAASTTGFPYIVVPNVNQTFFGAKDSIGTNALVQVDIYARATASLSEEESANSVFGLVRTALERQALTIASATHVETTFESAGYGWDDDGKTRRIISLWRVLYLA
jgi:hypothetical protein